ncbi:TPA: lipopolysaccharide biosynthesis protein [Vibrio alginolyticus]
MLNIRSAFFKNVFVIFSGTIVAQVLNILSVPFITRLYGPEAYGILGSFNAIATIFIPIVSLAYVYAIPLPKNDFISRNIAVKSLCIVIIFSVSFFLLLVINKALWDFFEIPIYFVFLMPIFLILSGVLQINQQILIRKGLFSTFAKSTVAASVVVITFKLVSGWVDPKASYLIISLLIGALVQILVSLYLNCDFWIRYFSKLRDFRKLLFSSSLKKYNDFPKYRAPQLLLNPLSRSLPIFFLSYSFGLSVVGQYTLAISMLSLPAVVIGNAIGDVFLKKVTQEFNSGNDIYTLVFKTTGLLFLVAFIPFSIVYIWGESIFSVFFGEEWNEAGIFASYIAIWQFFGFSNKCCTVTLPVISMNKFYFYFECVSLFLRLIILSLCFLLSFDVLDYIIYFSILGSILNLFLIFKVLLTLKSYKVGN